MQARLKLPEKDVLQSSLRPESPWLPDMGALIERSGCSEGYVTVETADRQDILLLFRGRPYTAGRYAASHFIPLDLGRFFHDAQQATQPEVQLCRAELGLILVLAVLFQHQPALRVPLKFADLERILSDIRKNKSDAAIVLATPGERSFAFCRQGEIASLYLAEPQAATPEQSLADTFLGYLYARPDDSERLVEVYHDLTVARDPHANRPLQDFLLGLLDPVPAFLRVTGRDVSEKRLIRSGHIRIGRAPDNDIVIDHSSVSREHVDIRWQQGRYVITDMQSSNGTLLNGVAVTKAEIQFGDRLKLGDFDVTFDAEPMHGNDSASTLFIDSPAAHSLSAQLLYAGRALPIETPIFTIGKGDSASLRLKRGFFIRETQATIVREGPGKYRLSAAEGGRAVRVNGEKIAFSGVVLSSGDQLAIGPHRLVFALVSEQ